MRVALIDDHALFRVGLRELLQRRGIDVLPDVAGCEAAIAQVLAERPDVVLLDMRMPDMSGLEVLKRLRAGAFAGPISLLTTSCEETDVIASLQHGAQGYLIKDMEPDDLVASLHEIVQGHTVVAKTLTGILARALKGGTRSVPPPTAFDDLTPREREILCHLAEGQSNKVIARNLGISDGTVKLHVKAILRKLDVHSRVEAAVMAVEQNLCARGGLET